MDIDIGEKVLVFNPSLSNKLKEHWHDGFVVSGKFLPDTYIVQNGKSKLRLNKKHVKRDHSNLAKGVSR